MSTFKTKHYSNRIFSTNYFKNTNTLTQKNDDTSVPSGLSLVQMLKSLFHPKEYVGGIPCDSPVPLACKDLTIYSVLKTGTDVPTSGFLVWNVLRGCYSITLSAMPSELQVTHTSGLNIGTYPMNPVWPVPILNSNNLLNIKPDLTQTMSLARLSAGAVTVYSATTSTTLAAINGELCGSSVTDLRNCGSFNVPDLVQASSTAKDGVCNVRPARGVTTVVGPDVGNRVKIVNYDMAALSGEDGVVNSPMFSSVALGASVGFVGGVFDPFQMNLLPSAFASTFKGTSWGSPIPQGIDITPSISFYVSPIPSGFAYNVTFEVGIGKVSSTGVVNVRSVLVPCQQVITNFNFTGEALYTASRVHVGFDEMVVYVFPNVTTAGSTPMFSFKTSITLHDAYGASGFGSYRIVRWDNIDTSQTLNIKGTFMVEGVPAGSIAPFVKGDHRMVSANTGHVMSGLRSIFANPRVYTRKVYISTDEQLNYEGQAADQVGSMMAAGMYAAGMYAGGFGDIGKALGGVVGDVAGTGLSLIGNGLDDAVSALFAGGQSRDIRPSKRMRLEF